MKEKPTPPEAARAAIEKLRASGELEHLPVYASEAVARAVLDAAPPRARPRRDRGAPAITYRATVRCVTTVDVVLDVLPDPSDGEEPIEMDDVQPRVRVNVPGAANAYDVDSVLRAFGALIGTHGAVLVTIEPDPGGAPAKGEAE